MLMCLARHVFGSFEALPERFNWQRRQPDVLFYPLRPELAESTYFLYQARAPSVHSVTILSQALTQRPLVIFGSRSLVIFGSPHLSVLNVIYIRTPLLLSPVSQLQIFHCFLCGMVFIFAFKVESFVVSPCTAP